MNIIVVGITIVYILPPDKVDSYVLKLPINCDTNRILLWDGI